MCCGRRVDDERLGVADIGEVTGKTQFIDHFAPLLSIAFYSKAENAAKGIGAKQLFGARVRFVGWKARVGNPGNFWVLLKPPLDEMRYY